MLGLCASVLEALGLPPGQSLYRGFRFGALAFRAERFLGL